MADQYGSNGGPIVAVLQARLGSTRLPGKVLSDLAGRPVLGWVVGRVRRSTRVDEVVVATSDAAGDDAIADWCAAEGVRCVRGSEADVLGRFVAAVDETGAGSVVRVNCDNPLIAPEWIDALLAVDRSELDYLSFRHADDRPVMLSAVSFFAEWLGGQALRRAGREIADPFLREHVTLGIYHDDHTRPGDWRVGWLKVPAFADDERLRLTIDRPDDLALLREMARSADLFTASAEQAALHAVSRARWVSAMAAGNNADPKAASEDTTQAAQPVKDMTA